MATWFKSLCLSTATLFVVAASMQSWAIWNETISVVGVDSNTIQTATVTFVLPGGDEVPGSVEQDDDGDPVLAFALPTDGPSAGSVRIETSDGSVDSYAVPSRNPGEVLILDTASGVVTAMPAGTGIPVVDSNWGIRIGLEGGLISSDHLVEVIDGSVAELEGLLTSNGVTGVSIDDSADDDATGYGVDISLFWAIPSLSDQGTVYVTGSYMETDTFDGNVVGSGTLGASAVDATQSVESDLEMLSLTFGYEHDLSTNWQLYGGIGWMWAEEDLSFGSDLLIDGNAVDSFQGSESEREDGWLVEAGIRFYFGSGSRSPISVDVGVTQTDELISDEAITMIAGRVQYNFSF